MKDLFSSYLDSRNPVNEMSLEYKLCMPTWINEKIYCAVLVRKYNQVMQRYYVQYLSGNDAVALNQMISMLVTMSEDESVILASLQSTIANLSVKQGI